MFRRVFVTSLAVVSLALTVPLTAQAQSFFVSGGAAFPNGDFGDVVDTGWLVVGGVTFDVGESGLWAGVEGSYGRHSTDIDGFNAKPYGVMGFLGYSFPTEGNVDPYFFGGAGLQGVSVSFPVGPSDSDSAFGYQFGGGLVFGNPANSVRPYVEGRYQGSSDDSVDLNFIGVLLGLTISAGS
jgi:Outer membrane protein beta-barrel domain